MLPDLGRSGSPTTRHHQPIVTEYYRDTDRHGLAEPFRHIKWREFVAIPDAVVWISIRVKQRRIALGQRFTWPANVHAIAESMTEEMESGDASASSDSAGALGTLKQLGTILAPITLLTGLLYFFGYLRARAFYSYFGLDLPSLGFSTTDYLVRSADTVFRPVAVLLAIALGAVVLHIGLTVALDQADARLVGRAALALAALAATLLLVGITELAFAAARIGNLLVAPVALITGAVSLEYATHIADARRLGSARTKRLLKETKAARRGLVIALVVFSAFWATSDVAHREGISAARLVATTLPIQTKVTIYSRDRLQLTGPGVQLVELTTTNTAYHYRYNGLRLLLHSGDRWFILRANWTPQDGQGVIILQDDQQQFRIEVAP